MHNLKELLKLLFKFAISSLLILFKIITGSGTFIKTHGQGHVGLPSIHMDPVKLALLRMELPAATIVRIVRTFTAHVSGSVNELSSLKEFPVLFIKFSPLIE